MLPKIIVAILRPFAGTVRYGALKIMKRTYQSQLQDSRPIIATADHILNEIILPSVFRFFREDKFRELAGFKKLPVCEHDRIFNELEVAGICLAVFYLRSAKSIGKPEDYHFWQNTETHLPKQFQHMLLRYGVDGANAKLVKQLVDIRQDEYEKLSREIWDANDNNKSEFKTLPPEMKDFIAAMQATAVVAVDHIRRGKVEEGDPLIRHMTAWLFALHKKIAKFVKNL